MVFEVIEKVLDSPFYILITIINLALIIAVILTFTEIKLRKKVEKPKKGKYDNYIEDLMTIKRSNKSSKLKLDAITGLSKNFFKEVYKIDQNFTYSELIQKFKKSNKKISEFCESMIAAYYSKEKISKEKINFLAFNLKRIIEIEIKKQAEGEKVQSYKLTEEQKRFQEEIAAAINYKKHMERAKNIISSNEKAVYLSKREINSPEDLQRLIKQNLNTYNEFKKLSLIIKQGHEKLNSVSSKIYEKSEKKQQEILKNTIEYWYKEHKEKLNYSTNPFRQQLMQLDLLLKYFSKIIAIAKSLQT